MFCARITHLSFIKQYTKGFIKGICKTFKLTLMFYVDKMPLNFILSRMHKDVARGLCN